MSVWRFVYAALGGASLVAYACVEKRAPVPPSDSPSDAAYASRAPVTLSAEAPERDAALEGASAEEPDVAAPTCPSGMRLVSGSYCPSVARTCINDELNGANHITLCHEFERHTTCNAPEEKRAFCIDEYEYPNEAGAHPAWMVTWHDAEATCGSLGKRLCYASEWTMACEGPDKTPFPYGWDRDHGACNFDNWWIPPKLADLEADASDVVRAELDRIDQSVASGAMPRCASGFGVRDMTGNFDEWVTNDEPVPALGSDTGKWSALKGGAWGHVRNACRPMTTSHAPSFLYYFVGFRCCKDADGAERYAPPKAAYRKPVTKPQDRAPPVSFSDAAVGPSRTKVPVPVRDAAPRDAR